MGAAEATGSARVATAGLGDDAFRNENPTDRTGSIFPLQRLASALLLMRMPSGWSTCNKVA
jgi:hypothetical protein